MSGAKSFTTFGPDPPPSKLRTDAPDFYNCIFKGAAQCDAAGDPSACDATVGSLAEGTGYCSMAQYAQTTYCACVNSPVADAGCFFAPCTRNVAYLPCKQQQIVKNGKCPPAVVCTQVIEVGGANNVVSGNVQQCGIWQTITHAASQNLYLTVMAFILLVALVYVWRTRPSEVVAARGGARRVKAGAGC